MFENHRKSIIQQCERSEQRFFRTWTSTLWTLIPPKSNISWFFNFLILGELGFKWDFFYDFLKTWNLRSNSVTRKVSFNKTKSGGKCQNTCMSKELFSKLIFFLFFSMMKYTILMRDHKYAKPSQFLSKKELNWLIFF